MWVELVGLLTLLWLLYKLWTSNYTYWKKRGFPYLESTFPMGNASGIAFMHKYQGEELKVLYDQMGEQKYVGIVIGRRPHLLLKDPEIIKNIMQKDFTHFTDRMNVDNIKEPISEHLFNLGGEKWKAFRVKLTPTFTSGKLKLMFSLFQSCAQNLEKLLASNLNNEIDAKDVTSRFSTDVIGTCAFGLEIDSINNPDSKFRKIAPLFFPNYVTMSRRIKNILTYIFPGMENYVRFQLMPSIIEGFFNKIVHDTIKYRETNQVKRNDFIDLLMEIRTKGSIKTDMSHIKQENGNSITEIEIKDEDLAAQVFVFFAAGFETSSSVTSYCLYELALHQDIQDRLRKEIKEVSDKHGGITYQSIAEMQYLDQVVSETMRKYPTIPILSRKCTRTYRMPDNEDLILSKDIRVLIPVFALHRDPQHFPEPDKFDPDRFSPENKSKIKNFTYLPFGEGPRICIGLRFGLLQTKLGIVTAVNNYQVAPSNNTPPSLTMGASSLITVVPEPIKLTLKKL